MYNPIQRIINITTKREKWGEKILYRKHQHQLTQQRIDQEASNTWLRKGNIFGETEGFMIAIQDATGKTSSRTTTQQQKNADGNSKLNI